MSGKGYFPKKRLSLEHTLPYSLCGICGSMEDTDLLLQQWVPCTLRMDLLELTYRNAKDGTNKKGAECWSKFEPTQPMHWEKKMQDRAYANVAIQDKHILEDNV